MDDDSQSFVRITNREIFDGLTNVQGRLTLLEQTVHSVLEDNVAIKKEYGKRLRAIELKNYTLMSGIVTACLLLLKVGFL
jgi:hypothetical protein